MSRETPRPADVADVLSRLGRTVFVLDSDLPARLVEYGRRVGDDDVLRLSSLVLEYDERIRVGTDLPSQLSLNAETEAWLLRDLMTSRLAIAAAETQEDEASWGRAAMHARIQARTDEALANWAPIALQIEDERLEAWQSSTNGYTLLYATTSDGTRLFVRTRGGPTETRIMRSARPSWTADDEHDG